MNGIIASIRSTQPQKVTCWTLLMILLALGSCRPDRCKNVPCEFGTCVEGNCICQSGYEGEDCSERQISKFEGYFQVSETCTAGSDSYTIWVGISDSSLYDARLSGIWGQPDTLVGLLSADGNALEFDRQPIVGKEISARLFFRPSESDFSLSYEVYDVGAMQPFDVCTANLTRP